VTEVIRVGAVEIAVARDGYWEAAPASHLRDLQNREIPIEQFEQVMPGADPTKVISSRVLSFVVKSGGKTILLDAGVGGWGLWRFGDGHLLESLRALDVAPGDIDYVIPSHLHLDHIGWNTHPGPDGRPEITFPHARHLFHKADWDWFTNPALYQREGPESLLNRTVETCLLPVMEANLVDLVDQETQVTYDVTILHTPGHTPGSVSILVQSGGESVLFIGDLVHLCMQLSAPDWSPPYETDREESARSRRRVVEEAVGRNAMIAGSHLDEGPVFGRMVTLDGRRFWRGLES
jgi:glyoxylase-like metal-dependent hydrolase (beta-lactamase superfamily II)